MHILLLLLSATVALATFSHQDDGVYVATISKSELLSDGVHSFSAEPRHLISKRRAPETLDHFLQEFSDDHHQPRVDLTLTGHELTKVSVAFPRPHSLTMPPFTVKVMTYRNKHVVPSKYYKTRKQRTQEEDVDENDGLSFDSRFHEVIMEETTVSPSAQSEGAHFDLTDPTPLGDMFDVITVILHTHPRVVTSFVYELSAIPDNMMSSSDMFDLTPFNSTMNMKFVAKYDEKEDALGIWVVRRPPIPDFSLMVSVDGKVELLESIAKPSPSGQGFPLAVPHAKGRRNAIIRLVVYFFENERQLHSCFPLKPLSDIGRALAKGSFIDEDIPDAKGFSLRISNESHADAFTVTVVQGSAIGGLSVSIYAALDGRRLPPPLGTHDMSSAVPHDHPVLIFREEEHYVPFIKPGDGVQFGWYAALPSTTEGIARAVRSRTSPRVVRARETSRGDDNEDDDDDLLLAEGAAEYPHLRIAACVDFNYRSEGISPFEDMVGWVSDFGGSLRSVSLSAASSSGRQGRQTAAGDGLVAREEIPQGAPVASIPYRLVLTTEVVEANEWVQQLMANASSFVKASVDLNIDVRQNQHFMLMTLFMLLKPASAIDGTNWRLYFDTIPIDKPIPVPLFLTAAERRLFSFVPLFDEQINRLEKLIQSEYESLVTQLPWIVDQVSFETYKIARAQLESRVFNISGSLVMLPAIDYINHDDNPSVGLQFSDSDQLVRVVARSRVPAGGSITMDYGVEARNKFDFMTQFGFIPKAAADVASFTFTSVDSSTINVFLTHSRQSRAPLIEALRSHIASGKSAEEGDTVDPAEVSQSEIRSLLTSILKKELSLLPPVSSLTLTAEETSKATSPRSLEYAQLLLEGFSAVLEQHIRWATESSPL